MNQDAFGFMGDLPPNADAIAANPGDWFPSASEVETAKAVILRHLQASPCEVRDKGKGASLSSSTAVSVYLKAKIGHSEREKFAVLFLDTRHRLIAFDVLFLGSVDRAMVYPREVIKAALKYNASAIILAHNHPSGVPEPSAADIQVTSRIAMVCQECDIRLVDHVVVSGTEHVSFAERGII